MCICVQSPLLTPDSLLPTALRCRARSASANPKMHPTPARFPLHRSCTGPAARGPTPSAARPPLARRRHHRRRRRRRRCRRCRRRRRSCGAALAALPAARREAWPLADRSWLFWSQRDCMLLRKASGLAAADWRRYVGDNAPLRLSDDSSPTRRAAFELFWPPGHICGFGTALAVSAAQWQGTLDSACCDCLCLRRWRKAPQRQIRIRFMYLWPQEGLSWIETAQAAESWQLREAPCLRFRLPMSSVVEGRRLCFRQGQCSTPSQCGCVQVGLKDYEDRHWDETRPSKKWRAQPERSF